MTIRRDRVVQCLTCPWRTSCVPERDIPNGYSCELHEDLRGTIASSPLASLAGLGDGGLRVMACHYSKPGDEFPCAGWLENQLGPGNNIAVRIGVATGRLPVPVTDGEQHETFEDTLPKSSRRKRRGRR